MKRRFDLPMLLFTLVLSALGMLVCLPLRDSLGNSVPGRAIWCALWFAVPLILGLIGVELGLALNSRRFRPARKRSFLAGFLAALLLGAAIGGGGGMLSMLEFRTASEITDPIDRRPEKTRPPKEDPPEEPPEDSEEPPEDSEEPAPPESTPPVDNQAKFKHIVLLIDASDSARRNDDEGRLAPCRIIDEMNEETSMQVAVFAYAPTVEDVRYKTDYLSLTDKVKESFKDFIQKTDIVGGTSFEGPIRLAVSTLADHSNDRESAAIIMFTDGDGPLSQEACEMVRDSGVRLYLVCDKPAETANAKQLFQLADATGGGGLSVSDAVGGSSLTAESKHSTVQTQVQVNTVQRESRFGLTFGENLPPDGFGEDGSVWRIGVCALTYVLYAVLVTVVYYRRLTLVGLAGSVCTGCLTVCAIAIDQRLCIPATAVLLLGAYTVYQVKEETSHV